VSRLLQNVERAFKPGFQAGYVGVRADVFHVRSRDMVSEAGDGMSARRVNVPEPPNAARTPVRYAL
jgi:hypothetical protein